MSTQEHGRADHAPYIAAVCRRIETCDIWVTEVRVTMSDDGRREANLILRPNHAAFAEQLPEQASASWDEENGWSMLARREPITSRVYKGLGVVPVPGDVATWAVVLLAHPELTPSYEDHPFRDRSEADPSFEAQLALYAPGH